MSKGVLSDSGGRSFLDSLPAKDRARLCASEDVEQANVCTWLDLNGIRYFAVPNGGARAKTTAARLKRTGVKAGVPDIIIVDKPSICPNATNGPVGHLRACAHNRTVPCPLSAPAVALEMKRAYGGRVEPEQRDWLSALDARGWVALVAHGYDDAVKQLTALGYARRTT